MKLPYLRRHETDSRCHVWLRASSWVRICRWFRQNNMGDRYTPTASSYMVAINRETKQTFGDSINIIHFQRHQLYTRWCKENPAEYQREKEEYMNFYTWDEKEFEAHIIYWLTDPPKVYRQMCDHGHEWNECILKFSKLSQDPQDLLRKYLYYKIV